MLSGDKGLQYHLLQPRDFISYKRHLQRHPLGTSLVIQWLRQSFQCNGCRFDPWLGFSDSSVGKESACNAGDPVLIPGLGRSTGEGIGYALQYPWASLVAQLVKNPPAMQETWVQSLGWKDLLVKGKATHCSYFGLENFMDCIAHGVTESQK